MICRSNQVRGFNIQIIVMSSKQRIWLDATQPQKNNFGSSGNFQESHQKAQSIAASIFLRHIYSLCPWMKEFDLEGQPHLLRNHSLAYKILIIRLLNRREDEEMLLLHPTCRCQHQSHIGSNDMFRSGKSIKSEQLAVNVLREKKIGKSTTCWENRGEPVGLSNGTEGDNAAWLTSLCMGSKLHFFS